MRGRKRRRAPSLAPFLAAVLLVLTWAPAALADIAYVYDALGRLVRVIREDGEAATYHYDAVGNLLSITRESGVPQTAVVSSTSASSADRGTTTTLTITGFNLAGANLSINAPGVTLANVRPGVDQIVVDVVISADAPLGDVAILLETADASFAAPLRVSDPFPRVVITSPVAGIVVLEHHQLTLIAEATDNRQVTQVVWTINGVAQSPLVAPPYQQTITVPTGVTSLRLQVVATDDLGQTSTDVRTVNVQPDPPPTVVITAPGEGITVIEGMPLTVSADVTDNVQVTEVVWSLNGVAEAPIFTPPYQQTVTVPSGVTSLRIEATATDNFGQTSTGVRTIFVQPDPGTTVVGRVVDTNGQPLAGATVTIFERFTAQSQVGGTFSIPGVPTIRGPIVAVAEAHVPDITLRGASAPTAPVSGGITDVGTLALRRIIQTSLYPGAAFATGGRPAAVVVADLNRDGKLDIVTSNVSSGDLSILLGNGDGTFQPDQRLAVGDGPGQGPPSVAVADLNGDGQPDLVAVNTFSNTVSILFGNGDGTFQPEQLLTMTGEFPNFVALADVNGDGRLDIVTANRGSADFSVFLGNGDGTFQPEQRFAAGDGAFFGPLSFTVADINGDGRPDLVAAVLFSSDLAVLLGNGDGTFQPQQRIPAGINARSVAVADVNGDGKPDLIVGSALSNGSAIALLLGNGDGTFQAPQLLAVGVMPSSVAVADLNNDGKLDLVTANTNSNDISVLLGNGDGTFLPEKRFAVGIGPVSVAVANVNGDGAVDVVTANNSSANISVLLGNGDGTFATRQRFALGNRPTAATAVDVNGDGKPDIVGVNSLSNDVSVLLGNGDGTFQPQLRFAAGSSPTAVAVADLNGDGRPDIVVTNGVSNDVSVLLGNGDGTFQLQQRFTVTGFPSAVALADVNGDGKLDIITANPNTGDVAVLLGNGDGTFQTPALRSAAGFNPNFGPKSLAVADLNGDGRPDLVAASDGEGTDNVSILIGNGDGTFQLGQRPGVGAGTRGIALADVNHDGKLDLVTANTFAGNISVLLGNGDGTFQAQQPIDLGANPRAVAIADVNGDGRLDVVTANDAGHVSVLLGLGDGTFQTPLRFVIGSGPRSVTVIDLNGDGKPDIVTGNNFSNDASVLLHQ